MGDSKIPAGEPGHYDVRPGPAGTRFTEIRTFAVIDSTNRYLLEEAAAGATEGLVAVAGHQSAGRGRQGRVWDSKPGASLLLSVLLRPREAAAAQRATQAMGLAIVDACSLIANVTASLKWPNDVLVGDRKVSGVLAEAETIGDELTMVVGAGTNLNWAGGLPEALEGTAASLDELAGRPIDQDLFLDCLLNALHQRLGRPTWLMQAYRQRCSTLGRDVSVELEEDTITGKAVDIADDGALVVEDASGSRHEVTAGDVVHLRTTTED